MTRQLTYLACCLVLLGSSATFGNTEIDGIQQPVEILTDRWGVAHIYAENEHDLFFAQGYNAAKDRLFQFEIWRRQATGTVAEILGRRELKRDIGTRLHLFRKDLPTELNHYHPRGEAIVNAFVNGINAYIAQTEADPSLLPPEFSWLGIKPGRWTPEVVISRHQGLLSNVTTELRLAQAVSKTDAATVRELDWLRPGEPNLTLDPAIDGRLINDDILELYLAFRRPLTFEPADVASRFRSSFEMYAAPGVADIATGYGNDGIGSNNWVVSGRFTQTGYPYMANDPHRSLAVPSLRYFVHLHAPGWNVIGGGEPVLPGISIGHNDQGAWGLTVFGQDNEDLYVYDTNPENPNQYRYLDGYEDMRVIEETIAVRGEQPETVLLKYTRHGPVLFEDQENHKAYALRAAWMEIGNAPYLASLRMNQAMTWEEFVDACSYSRIPAENMVWADRDKNIGYQAVGISPIRPGWSGLVPVPGDGRYEWDGFLPIKALPHVLNPPRGYWATANNYMLPDNYPYEDAIHFTWGDEMRGLRADELMATGRRHTMVDMMNYQHDQLSVPARNIVPLLRVIEIDDRAVREARERLVEWDFKIDATSVAAAIYVKFEHNLMKRVIETVVPSPLAADTTRINKKRMIDWLVAPDGRFGDDPLAARDAILSASLADAVAQLRELRGKNMDKWQYGGSDFKHVEFTHALSPVVNAERQKMIDVGPAPRGGYDSTLNNTGRTDNQRSGATFRVIIDTENWDNSLATNAPGQSGDPRSPHYRDLFDLWVKHQYFPLFYSRPKVESVTESRTVLQPAASP
jgi:penicillin amidase